MSEKFTPYFEYAYVEDSLDPHRIVYNFNQMESWTTTLSGKDVYDQMKQLRSVLDRVIDGMERDFDKERKSPEGVD